jgi:micrococcal nuclease
MDFPEKLQKEFKVSRSLQKVIISVSVLFLFVGLFYPFFTSSKTVEVVKIADGDTVDVRLNGEIETIRMKGIDTPETAGYNTPEEYQGVPKHNWKCLEKWGYNAKDYVANKIEGKDITLAYRKGVFTVERGIFNRLLGKIYVSDSGRSLNQILVEKGYARSYGDYYQNIENKARMNKSGLWECAQ